MEYEIEALIDELDNTNEEKMADIVIKHIYDSRDCETCGNSWEDGFEVTVNGVDFGNYKPFAYCWDGKSYDISEVYKGLLKAFGHNVEEIQ